MSHFLPDNCAFEGTRPVFWGLSTPLLRAGEQLYVFLQSADATFFEHTAVLIMGYLNDLPKA